MSFTKIFNIIAVDLLLNIAIFCTTPLLLFFYTSDLIGQYSILQATVAFGSIFSTLRLETKIRGAEPSDFIRIFNQLLVLAAPLSLISIFSFWIVSLSYGGETASLTTYLVAAAASYFIGISNLYGLLSVHKDCTTVLNASRTSRVVFLVGIQLFFPFLFKIASIYFLTLSVLVSSLILFIINYIYYKDVINFRHFKKNASLIMLRENRMIIFHYLPAALLVSFSDAILALGLFSSSPSYAGLFFISDRLLRTPITLINNWLRQFIISGAINISRNLLINIGITTIVLVIFIEILIQLVKPYAKDFSQVSDIFSVLLIYYSLQFFVSILSSLAIRKAHDSVATSYALLYITGTLLSLGLNSLIHSLEFHYIFSISLSTAMLIQFLYCMKFMKE